MKKNNILVTGGAGFIGSHLCERLAQDDGNQVFSLDNYLMGSVANHVSNVEYIEGCVSDINKLVGFKPDIIYHLGEYSRVEQSFKDISTVWESNMIGTFNVLEFVRKSSSKIIYAGSSTKFGDGGLGRFSSPYAWTKASNTDLVINYGKWFNIPYAITYFYNVYGPREIRDGEYATIVAKFTKLMKERKPLTVVSPGTQERNFTHIYDVIDALILVGKDAIGDGFGIGNRQTYSILELAKLFGGEIEMIPERAGNRMTADLITQSTEDLGWKPARNLETYIADLREKDWDISEV